MNSERLHLLALTYVPNLGPVNQRKIVKAIDPAELWGLSKKDLEELFGNRKDLIPSFQSKKYLDLAEKEIEFCQKNNIRILAYNNDSYPDKLEHCADAPLILFQKGNYDFNRKLHLGIVGTRKMTAYGKKFIENLIDDLSNQNICIVSGLAFGCDIEAHIRCNQNNIPNVAVLAEGLNRISPSAHEKEAKKITENGALVSEYSSFHPTESFNFVLRNRIIAGLCDGVVVVESAKRGGALATANYANSYNREVFAVPGRTTDKYSEGCNDLIYTNRASILRGSDDLLEYFNLKSRPQPKQFELFVELEPEEKMVYDYLRENGRQQIDLLAMAVQIPSYKLSGILLNLELKNVVKSFTGKFYGLE